MQCHIRTEKPPLQVAKSPARGALLNGNAFLPPEIRLKGEENLSTLYRSYADSIHVNALQTANGPIMIERNIRALV
jgi:hypothetical protein